MTFEIRTTIEFDDWLGSLKDRRDIFRISARIDRIEQGNLGDTKPFHSSVFSLVQVIGFITPKKKRPSSYC